LIDYFYYSGGKQLFKKIENQKNALSHRSQQLLHNQIKKKILAESNKEGLSVNEKQRYLD